MSSCRISIIDRPSLYWNSIIPGQFENYPAEPSAAALSDFLRGIWLFPKMGGPKIDTNILLSFLGGLLKRAIIYLKHRCRLAPVAFCGCSDVQRDLLVPSVLLNGARQLIRS